MIPNTDLYKESQYTLLENGSADANGTSMLTTMFTIADIQDAIAQRQAEFIRDTGIIVLRATVGTTPGSGEYALPVDNSIPRRLAWHPASGKITGLSRTDTWGADNGLSTWTSTPGEPIAWLQTTLNNQKFSLIPPPDAPGQIDLLYSQLPDSIPSGNVGIPDDWVEYVKWGALGDLLGREGESSDPVRAGYCWQRYSEGVELARLVLMGPMG